MKATSSSTRIENTLWELATLSADPALTFRPDPTFRAKFRNADETFEGNFNGFDTDTRPLSMTSARWRGVACWRRSPKD